MRNLLLLLVHPTHIAKGRKRVPAPLAHLSAAGFVALAGLAFQYLYPRLLNEVPWLGLLRRMNPANWSPAFDPDLFARGAGMGALLVVSYTGAYWLMGQLTPGRGKPMGVCYLAALATCVPLLITAGAGYGFHYLHLGFGILPAYGLLTSACLNVLLLNDLFRVHRAAIVYLAPATLVFQLCGAYLLMP